MKVLIAKHRHDELSQSQQENSHFEESTHAALHQEFVGDIAVKEEESISIIVEETRASNETMVDDVVKLYTLNTKQEEAFRLMVRNVIKRQNKEGTSQIMLYLGGMGGTGKSQVIKALKHLHTKLGILHTLKIAAFTGTAAANIDGSTISSLACLGGYNSDSPNVKNLETT